MRAVIDNRAGPYLKPGVQALAVVGQSVASVTNMKKVAVHASA